MSDALYSYRALSKDDIPALQALTRCVWQATYSELISQAQIDYMLAQRYGTAQIVQELESPAHHWRVALDAQGALLGFAAGVHIPADQEVKLDKLYVHPQQQGQGVGRALLAQMEQWARSLSCRALFLAVNKKNARALAAYRVYGFQVRADVCVDIGHGFVMDDYLMAKSLL